jgi:hypothetical protein
MIRIISSARSSQWPWTEGRWYSKGRGGVGSGGGKRKVQGQKESIQEGDVDYSEVMYGRRHRERTDSLSPEMLQDRLNHKKKIDLFPKPTSLTRELCALGHGKKTRLNNVYEIMQPTAESWMSKTAPRTATGAGP